MDLTNSVSYLCSTYGIRLLVYDDCTQVTDVDGTANLLPAYLMAWMF